MLKIRTDDHRMSTPDNTKETETGIRAAHENGHFYSPIVDPAELQSQVERLWPAQPEILGIDFNDASHEHVLRELFPRYISGYEYPELLEETPDLRRFYTGNSQFG